LKDFEEFTQGTSQTDDITFVIIESTGETIWGGATIARPGVRRGRR